MHHTRTNKQTNRHGTHLCEAKQSATNKDGQFCYATLTQGVTRIYGYIYIYICVVELVHIPTYSLAFIYRFNM